MKLKIKLMICFLFEALKMTAQTDQQISILTTDGIITVSTTMSGHQSINISYDQWNQMQKGTSYVYEKLSDSGTDVYIEIADCKRNCSAGIGFNCSIYPRKAAIKCDHIVTSNSRICAVKLYARFSCIKMVFLDSIDWKQLE